MPGPNKDQLFPLNSLEESALATVAFFDVFDYPLTLTELQQNILGPHPDSEKLKDFLISHQKIETQNGYFFLKGKNDNIRIRENREKTSVKLWKKVYRFIPLLQLVPFIQMVAVCNTLAMNNPTAASDIDLFIIANHGRLNLVRTLTTILFSVLGIRRHGNKIAGKFCLSFYMTDQDLNLEKIQQKIDANLPDIYLAYWIISLQPIFDNGIYKKILEENKWLNLFFQRQPKPRFEHLQKRGWLSFFGKIQELLLSGKMKKIGDFFEEKLSTSQQKRHQRNLQKLGPESSVIINNNMLKFHNIDRREEFAKKFLKNYQDLQNCSTS